MSLSRIISRISLLIWLFPPLRQYRGRFFYYFLFLAISDPLVMILFSYKLPNLPLYLILDIMTVMSLWNPELMKIQKLRITIPVIIIPISIIYYIASNIPYTIIFGFFIVLHVIIIYFVFKFSSIDILETNRLKLFYFIIVLYELSIILKFAFVLANIKTGLIFYYSTTAFELILGIFFIFVNEDNKRLVIPIKVSG